MNDCFDLNLEALILLLLFHSNTQSVVGKVLRNTKYVEQIAMVYVRDYAVAAMMIECNLYTT